ncbi:hypothetical protein CERSUDRAFT_116291 [Gelatoporia subvermispora B]|uniref:Uncharacterized protein n=1 Tax=Ceriporiopsis subvermispora (strain B) TaxID=914234 RepID=M2PHK1_CERS8|nr:hypothetical protein CERSUDRAFT_116291 [Gelatoporia subvermispora B]
MARAEGNEGIHSGDNACGHGGASRMDWCFLRTIGKVYVDAWRYVSSPATSQVVEQRIREVHG